MTSISPATANAVRPRAIFLDVDGTILQDGRHIPPSAVEAIRAARARGHLVFLSTGRGTAELHGDLQAIGFDGAVTNGGAFASIGERVITATLFTPDEVARLQGYLADHGLHGYFQSYDRLFGSPELADLFAERFGAAGFPRKDFHDPAEFDPARMAKLVFVTDDADAAQRALTELAADFEVVGGTIPVAFAASGEVAPRGVHKGSAIVSLLAELGLDASDAVGIGDNWNDIEMFAAVGTAIAMGNAVDGVKALADQVTTAIDDDGLHTAFLRNGLI
ncbi:HAD family phosphatase [Microbacterium sp. VKM Ac-2870]|uniref:Cof-type HAD-IIB family hydrolase n=1 Tax=Microbacterium sp. VKM Ac-2870 TaxID=2783825 RepID=UPI00188BD6E2|nr:HAD family hydrolase [Microbacterium sp. VKM Ac-2870]MBF4562277.1 HAD family phosphatase [Microbacterium sp. VKM Ac-2870]